MNLKKINVMKLMKIYNKIINLKIIINKKIK